MNDLVDEFFGEWEKFFAVLIGLVLGAIVALVGVIFGRIYG